MSQWVENALVHAQIDQAELARRLSERLRPGYDRSKVNKMALDKRRVSGDEMLAIETITNFPIPAALRNQSMDEKPTKKVVSVPLLDFVTAGKLKAPSSQIPIEDARMLVFSDLGRGDWFALELEVDADSMDRISPPGSIVVVNKSDRELRSGKCYIFAVEGEVTYKMWQEGDPPYLAPHSTNPLHRPRFVRRKRDLEVIGRVRRTVFDL
jgi:SOS-response transcriptional repressor LexA